MTELFPTWDDVLAECESTAAHAEALLRARGHATIRPIPPRWSLDELTANLGRPSEDVVRRAKALQERHLDLQRELAQSMRDIDHQSQLLADGSRFLQATPLYLDRTV